MNEEETELARALVALPMRPRPRRVGGGVIRVNRPWDYLAYLLAQQAAATGDRDRALRRGDPVTADVLRVGFGAPS